MTKIGRFRMSREEIDEYTKILSDFADKQNYQSLGRKIDYWSRKYGRDPKTVYRFQMKVFK